MRQASPRGVSTGWSAPSSSEEIGFGVSAATPVVSNVGGVASRSRHLGPTLSQAMLVRVEVLRHRTRDGRRWLTFHPRALRDPAHRQGRKRRRRTSPRQLVRVSRRQSPNRRHPARPGLVTPSCSGASPCAPPAASPGGSPRAISRSRRARFVAEHELHYPVRASEVAVEVAALRCIGHAGDLVVSLGQLSHNRAGFAGAPRRVHRQPRRVARAMVQAALRRAASPGSASRRIL